MSRRAFLGLDQRAAVHRRIWAHALALAVCLAVPVQAAAAPDCSALVAIKPEATTITSASVVSGPSSIGGARVGVPFCRVEGVARPSSDSEVRFEVWLPAAE